MGKPCELTTKLKFQCTAPLESSRTIINEKLKLIKIINRSDRNEN